MSGPDCRRILDRETPQAWSKKVTQTSVLRKSKSCAAANHGDLIGRRTTLDEIGVYGL